MDEERHPLLDEIMQGIGIKKNDSVLLTQGKQETKQTVPEEQQSNPIQEKPTADEKKSEVKLEQPVEQKTEEQITKTETNTGSESSQMMNKTAEALGEEQTKEEMAKVLDELKQKMDHIDKITEELEKKRIEFGKTPPRKTEKILEEIKVPPLEMLK